MTEQEFLDKFLDTYFGHIADAYMNEVRGSELSVRLRNSLNKARNQMKAIYAALKPKGETK